MSSVSVVARPIRVAVELPDYWIELTGRDGLDPLDLLAHPPNVARIRVSDLREAQRARAGVRAQLVADGRDPDSVTVLLDVDTLIATTAPAARRELAQLDSAVRRAQQETVSYVGTPTGLLSLISDVQAAEVADGVTLRPLALPGTLELVASEVVPWLQTRGSADRSASLEKLLDRFGAQAVNRAVAS